MLPPYAANSFAATNHKTYQMKISIALIICAVIAVGCNKETAGSNKPEVSITGPWRGIAGYRSVLYNKADGSATLFFVEGTDTTGATDKYHGTYTYSNATYSGRFIAPSDTFYLELTSPTPNRLSGLYGITSGVVGLAEFVRLR